MSEMFQGWHTINYTLKLSFVLSSLYYFTQNPCTIFLQAYFCLAEGFILD